MLKKGKDKRYISAFKWLFTLKPIKRAYNVLRIVIIVKATIIISLNIYFASFIK